MTRPDLERAGEDRHSPHLKRRILIVEDDPDLWSLLGRYSKTLDPTLVLDFCDTPTDATRRLSEGIRYDAVVADFCLPAPGDGYEVRSSAESLQPWARFGMISALMGFKPKKIPYLSKPFTSNQYRSFLSELLG